MSVCNKKAYFLYSRDFDDIWVVFPRTGKISKICHNFFFDKYCGKIILAGGKIIFAVQVGKLFWQRENYFGRWEIYFGRGGAKIILASGKIILGGAKII